MKMFIFVAVLLVQILCKNMVAVYADQSIERFSDVCGRVEDILEPPQNFTDKSGTLYELRRREVEEISTTGEFREITEEVIYEGADPADMVPMTIMVRIWDSKSQTSVKAELPLRESFLSEPYQEPLSFPVTLHRFGSDAYRFGEVEIPAEEILDRLWTYEDLILTEAGLNAEDAELQNFVWGEETFEDSEGNICRDVIASGSRRVWDHTAVYEGEIKMPDYICFREKCRYEKAAEDRKESMAAEDGESLASENEATEATGTNDFRDTIKRIVRICLEITIGLFFVFLLVLGLRGPILLWKKWRKKE